MPGSESAEKAQGHAGVAEFAAAGWARNRMKFQVVTLREGHTPVACALGFWGGRAPAARKAVASVVVLRLYEQSGSGTVYQRERAARAWLCR